MLAVVGVGLAGTLLARALGVHSADDLQERMQALLAPIGQHAQQHAVPWRLWLQVGCHLPATSHRCLCCETNSWSYAKASWASSLLDPFCTHMRTDMKRESIQPPPLPPFPSPRSFLAEQGKGLKSCVQGSCQVRMLSCIAEYFLPSPHHIAAS